MAERCNLSRWTRVDVLVAGAACLLLLVVVSVLLAKPREQSARQLCAANLAQIGKLMLAYANDYNGALPRAGGPTSTWGMVVNYLQPNRIPAFGLNVDGNGGTATISSCFYLLVKYYQAPPRLFLCQDDKGTTEFKLSDMQDLIGTRIEFCDAWDFGPPGESWKHCSFAYQTPFSKYPLTTARDPNLPVAADRNPWLNSPAGTAQQLSNGFKPDLKPYYGTPEMARIGNAFAHGLASQNVLFLDGRVRFEKRAFCGLDNDNIYLLSDFPQRGSPFGTLPVPPLVGLPLNDRDSVLVHDPNNFGSSTKTGGAR